MTAPLRATGNDRGLDPMLTPGTTPLIRAAKAMDARVDEGAAGARGRYFDLTTSRNMTATLAASGMGSTDADTRGYFATSDVQERAIAALELMFQHGGPINGKAGQFAQVPLHGAAFWGWNDVVEYSAEERARTSTSPTAAATPPSITPWAGRVGTAAAASASTSTRTRRIC